MAHKQSRRVEQSQPIATAPAAAALAKGGKKLPTDERTRESGGVMRQDLFRIYSYLPLVLAALIVVAALSGCGGKGGGY